ncbi:hypothetical protein [Methylocystis suflitae]|uniref:hypothetical protein n=1 Tax=Methylocystis suflitae TaxID=2951405 RepID=UPI00210D6365|nr:hypothetical protein [Methylocystis suflitae]MCQ4189860.1 hypothetical protein [Methylocystis suflitae]
MLRTFLMISAAAAAFATSFYASAQPVEEWYIVQDSRTKRCTVVDKRPTTESMVVVGPHGYPSRVEAQTGMKSVTVCESR